MSIDRSSIHPGVIDPAVLDPYVAALGPLARRLWPATFHGFDNLPADKGVLVIANHSGMGSAELWTMLLEWYTRFGTSRPFAGMAHPAAFRVPPLRRFLQGVGAVEATREGAAKARRAGVPLLLFPGGDHEAARPVWQADRVDFAGRRGWIRLAREHNLAIAPLCISGSHVTLPIVARGRAVSWLTGMRLLGTHRAPLPALSVAAAGLAFSAAGALGLPLAIAAATMWPAVWATLMVPWVPSRIGFHFLPAISAADVATRTDDDLYDDVVGTLGRTLLAANTAARERPTPARDAAVTVGD